ncbi:MAG: DUF481 domain-containing protein, partial [Candidatus Electrothrix sp.]
VQTLSTYTKKTYKNRGKIVSAFIDSRKTKPIIMLVALAALLTTPAYAEDNGLGEGNISENLLSLEKSPLSEQEKSVSQAPSTWSASLSLGASMASGNTNNFNSNVNFSGTKLIGRDKIMLMLEGSYGEARSYGEAENAVVDQQAMAFTMYEKRIDRYIAYPFIELKHDKMNEIELRIMTGFGGGYYFIENEQTEFSIVTGPAYIREDLTTDESDEYGVFFIGLLHKLALSETFRISESVDFLPKMKDTSDYRLKMRADIETDIWSNISLKFTVKDEYDSEPPDGLDENNLSLSTSLVFTL